MIKANWLMLKAEGKLTGHKISPLDKRLVFERFLVGKGRC